MDPYNFLTSLGPKPPQYDGSNEIVIPKIWMLTIFQSQVENQQVLLIVLLVLSSCLGVT